jgi:hypothetical protein
MPPFATDLISINEAGAGAAEKGWLCFPPPACAAKVRHDQFSPLAICVDVFLVLHGTKLGVAVTGGEWEARWHEQYRRSRTDPLRRTRCLPVLHVLPAFTGGGSRCQFVETLARSWLWPPWTIGSPARLRSSARPRPPPGRVESRRGTASVTLSATYPLSCSHGVWEQKKRNIGRPCLLMRL